MTDEGQTFAMPDLWDRGHVVGDRDCSQCWATPWACDGGECEGLVHNTFGGAT